MKVSFEANNKTLFINQHGYIFDAKDSVLGHKDYSAKELSGKAADEAQAKLAAQIKSLNV